MMAKRLPSRIKAALSRFVRTCVYCFLALVLLAVMCSLGACAPPKLPAMSWGQGAEMVCFAVMLGIAGVLFVRGIRRYLEARRDPAAALRQREELQREVKAAEGAR